MKNVLQKSLRRMFCLAVMLGMLPVVSFGQNVIYELDNQKSDFSIVRYYQNDVDITYSRHGTTVNCFNYVDRANLLYYRADIDLGINMYRNANQQGIKNYKYSQENWSIDRVAEKIKEALQKISA